MSTTRWNDRSNPAVAESSRGTEWRNIVTRVHGHDPADDRLRREPQQLVEVGVTPTLQIGEAICAHGSPSVPVTRRTTTSCVQSPVVGRLNHSSSSAWRITS